MKFMKTSKGECKTRAPIPYEWNLYNWFYQKFGALPPFAQELPQPLEDPLVFGNFLQSLQDNPPEVMTVGGSFAVVPFDWGIRGATMGRVHPLLGDWTGEIPHGCNGFNRLLPADLAQRIARIEEYVQDLHSQGGVKRVMPYIDFGTQFFGRHNKPDPIPDPCTVADFIAGGCKKPDPDPTTDCPPEVVPNAWGFWDFYDHWEEYAEPTGPFGLGPKPPPPKWWLAEWHDPNGKQWQELPDELKGLSFSYRPRKCCAYGPTYRYVVCPNTKGWALWWKQVIQWAARVGYDGVFIDNSVLTSCWNQECQEGYQAWLQKNFTAEEIRRYFTTTTNNLLSNPNNDPSIEGAWFREEVLPGKWQWRATSWGSYPAQISPNPIFPDTDACGGRYSCRIEGPGGSDVAVFSHSTVAQLVPANEDMLLTFYYKTEGVVEVKAIIDNAVAPKLIKVLSLTDTWEEFVVPFHSKADSSGQIDFFLGFEVKGTGKVWLDEFWLGKVSQPPEFKVEMWRPSDDPSDPVRRWAVLTYWSQMADEKLGYLRKQARQVNPKFELFTNGVHAVNADYFMIEGRVIEAEAYRFDVGFYPGVYQPNPPIEIKGNKPKPKLLTEPLVVTNIFDYKYIHSQRVPGFFGYFMPLWYDAAQGSYDHNPDSALLNLAEAAAFGGGAGCDNQLRSLYNVYQAPADLYINVPEVVAKIRAVEKRFWTFIKAHKHRYSGYHTHADVGIVYHDIPDSDPFDEFHHLMDLAKGLAGRGVLWDVLTENRCNKKNFSRLRVLIYQDVTRISEAEAEAVLEFIGQGGLVIAAGIVGDLDEWFRMRLSEPGPAWPPVGLPPTDNIGTRARPAAFEQLEGAGKLIYRPLALDVGDVIADMEGHLGRTVQMVENVPVAAVERLRLNAWIRKEGGGTITLHVLNYDVPLGKDNGNQVQPLSDVHISVPLPPQMQVQLVRLYSPESNSPPQAASFVIANGLVTFQIPSLRIYTMAIIE